MSFRKKNISITPSRGGPSPPSPTPSTTSSSFSSASAALPATTTTPSPGVRLSPLSGHPITSTGTPSLDGLLSSHTGLPLGTSLLIEESGSTDFGGALLRYYAAEGILQAHHVIVVGMGEGWVRELPAAVGEEGERDGGGSGEKGRERERMKIAWRYEKLGEFGAERRVRGGADVRKTSGGGEATATALQAAWGGENTEVTGATSTSTSTPISPPHPSPPSKPFCHSFDLTKRLTIPPDSQITFLSLPPPFPTPTTAQTSASPFQAILTKLHTLLHQHPTHTIHRLVIPNLLSPALYPPHAAHPQHLLRFMHSLRALLRKFSAQLTAMISLPLELYPRDGGVIRWVEILSDGVMELVPLPRMMEMASRMGAKGREHVPMGLVKVWKVPELGTGVGAGVMGEDLAFTVTRKRFKISTYNLPPADEEEGTGGGGDGGPRAEQGLESAGRNTRMDIEF